MNRVAILGAGIAGLAAARRLYRSAPHVDVAIVEAHDRLGGKIITERSSGLVIEGGPDSFLRSKPAGMALCRELGIEDRLQGTDEHHRHTFVLRGGRLVEIPEGLTGLVPTRLEPLLASDLLSPAGKARLEREPELPPSTAPGDESLASFVERRFGGEVYDRLIEPLMAGIYAGDGRFLSLAATFPQLRRLELTHGSVIQGLRAGFPSGGAPGTGQTGFATPIGGMEELIDALSDGIGSPRRLQGTAARRISAANGGYGVRLARGETLDVDAVVVATPANVACELLADLLPHGAAELGAIRHASSATVSLAYSRGQVSHPLDGYGYVVPRAEGRPVLACTWVSSKFAHRCPPDRVLLRVFAGGMGREDVLAGSDEELVGIARDELRETLGIQGAASLTRVFRWPDGTPQYELGYPERLARIEASLAELPGVYLAGPYRGVGIPDCIQSGETAARAAAAFLAKKNARP